MNASRRCSTALTLSNPRRAGRHCGRAVEQLTWRNSRHTKPILILDIGGFARCAALSPTCFFKAFREGFEARYLWPKNRGRAPMLRAAGERRSVEPEPQDSVSPRNM
jgi:hypothetical protein